MGQVERVHDIIRKAEVNYLNGYTKLGRYVTWNMHYTLERIDAYLNSQHISGKKDSLNRDKPFFNIVSAACNIWYRATDIDRKNVRFVPTNASSTVLSFIANVLLQNWMNDNRFGQFLNLWGRELARYGSAVVKFVEKDGKLVPSVVPWNRIIADAVQYDALPRIEKLYFTPAQLRQQTEYDQEAVDEIIRMKNTRKTLDKLQKDIKNDFIEVYEVHGMLDSRLLEKTPDQSIPDNEIKYVQQMHVVSYVATGQGEGEYKDFTLYKGREAKDPYMITHLIEEDGRTLAIGAVEYLFESQWMVNHSVKNIKDTLDITSKLIFQTADSQFATRNVLTAIESGDILVHQENMPLQAVTNSKPDIGQLMQFAEQWQSIGRDITNTPGVMRGENMPSHTAYRMQALQLQEANSLFELMTENKGLALEDMLRTYVIPHLRKQLKNTDEVVAILDDAGIQEIDAMYIPHEAMKRYNKQAADQLFAQIEDPNAPLPSPYMPEVMQGQVRADLTSSGNKRFFKPDDLGKKTWADLFSDYEWDAIRLEITDENFDKQAILQTLSTVLQTIAGNPAVLQDPSAKMVFNQILSTAGAISPLQIMSTPPQQQPQQMPPNAPGAPGGGGALPVAAQQNGR